MVPYYEDLDTANCISAFAIGVACPLSGLLSSSNCNAFFQLMISWVRATQVLSLQSNLS